MYALVGLILLAAIVTLIGAIGSLLARKNTLVFDSFIGLFIGGGISLFTFGLPGFIYWILSI